MQCRDILTLAAAGAIPGLASAQASSSTLRLVVPFPQGGATDITARVLAGPLSRILGMPVKVDNLPGAGGATGMQAVAKAAADGMTLGVATLSTHGVNPAVYKKLPYDAIKDFAAVTEIVKAPGVLVVHPSVPAQNFEQFIKLLKSQPGKITYATPGAGTIGHMWAELLQSTTGTSMKHVPFRGAAPAVADLLEAKGWHINRLQKPESLQVILNAGHAAVIDPLLADLREAVAQVRAHPDAAFEGSAPMYGLIANMPLRRVVRKNLVSIFTKMHTVGEPGPEEAGEEEKDPVAVPPAVLWLMRTRARLGRLFTPRQRD